MLGVAGLILIMTGCATVSPAEKAVNEAARVQGLDPLAYGGSVHFEDASKTRGTVEVDLLVGSGEKRYSLSFQALPDGTYIFGCPKNGIIVQITDPFVRDSLNHDWRCPAIYP